MLKTRSTPAFSRQRKPWQIIKSHQHSILIFIAILPFFVTLVGCSGKSNNNKLPYLGRDEIVERNGQKDTVPHKIDDFRFVDQDSTFITPETFANKIYVADFFFTSCPTICPTMKKQMKRVYKRYEDNPRVAFLSHSIDPEHDSVAVLKKYAKDMGVSSAKWHFVTGKKDSIYSIAQDYMVSAREDESAPGGYVHSGAFILVDENRHIRGVYDGTSKEDVNELMEDIQVLLKEEKEKKS